MSDTTFSPSLMKGKWLNVAEGKLPVKVTYNVKEKSGREYHVTRRHWVLPEEALSGNYELDFEKIDEDKIRLPTPDNLERLHTHYGAEEPHPVYAQHKNDEVQAEHRDERIKYDRDYYKVLQQRDDLERQSGEKESRLDLKREKPKRKISSKDKKELKDIIDKISETTEKFERRKAIKSWIDEYNVVVEPDKKIKYKGVYINTFAYSLPDSKRKIYVFNDILGNCYLLSEKFGLEKFSRSDQAYDKLREIFSTKHLRDSILHKAFDLERKTIINKVWNLIDDISSLSPISSLNSNIKTDFKIFSEFQSGNNKIALEGNKDQYRISVNNIPLLTTERFKEALAKYYSEVSKIIDAQNENKDFALEMFGEHVLQTSKNARRLLNEMNKMEEVDLIENMSYEDLSIPFNEKVFDYTLKDIVTKADPQSDFFGIVPVNEEMGAGMSEHGVKPSRGDLTESDYKKYKPDEKCQQPIEEEKSQGIQPAIITNSEKINQYQQCETRQEENKEVKDVEKPIRVKNIYTQRLHPKEQEIIQE